MSQQKDLHLKDLFLKRGAISKACLSKIGPAQVGLTANFHSLLANVWRLQCMYFGLAKSRSEAAFEIQMVCSLCCLRTRLHPNCEVVQ